MFYLKNDTTKESYFGWMYKEKNISRVNKVVKNLEEFVCDINLLVQVNQKINKNCKQDKARNT